MKQGQLIQSPSITCHADLLRSTVDALRVSRGAATLEPCSQSESCASCPLSHSVILPVAQQWCNPPLVERREKLTNRTASHSGSAFITKGFWTDSKAKISAILKIKCTEIDPSLFMHCTFYISYTVSASVNNMRGWMFLWVFSTVFTWCVHILIV